MQFFDWIRKILIKDDISQMPSLPIQNVTPKGNIARKATLPITNISSKDNIVRQPSLPIRNNTPRQPSKAAGMRRGNAVIVLPDIRPLWQIKGWQKQSEYELIGAFRTPQGSFVGKITITDGKPSYYIQNPPKQLLNGSHGACFRRRLKGWYWIHFSKEPRDLDSGIAAVERLIFEALN
jgi:hypothetical protein